LSKSNRKLRFAKFFQHLTNGRNEVGTGGKYPTLSHGERNMLYPTMFSLDVSYLKSVNKCDVCRFWCEEIFMFDV